MDGIKNSNLPDDIVFRLTSTLEPDIADLEGFIYGNPDPMGCLHDICSSRRAGEVFGFLPNEDFLRRVALLGFIASDEGSYKDEFFTIKEELSNKQNGNYNLEDLEERITSLLLLGKISQLVQEFKGKSSTESNDFEIGNNLFLALDEENGVDFYQIDEKGNKVSVELDLEALKKVADNFTSRIMDQELEIGKEEVFDIFSSTAKERGLKPDENGNTYLKISDQDFVIRGQEVLFWNEGKWEDFSQNSEVFIEVIDDNLEKSIGENSFVQEEQQESAIKVEEEDKAPSTTLTGVSALNIADVGKENFEQESEQENKGSVVSR